MHANVNSKNMLKSYLTSPVKGMTRMIMLFMAPQMLKVFAWLSKLLLPEKGMV
jgi:hypothetical protein